MTLTCSLCLQKKELRASHVIPRFIGKWLKTTSGTGFMTGAERPEERIQDFPTLPLLCSSCEERFSKLETYFANEIFFPFQRKKIRSFEYDKRLVAFVVSLSWRTLKASYDEMKEQEPDLLPHVDKAEFEWRRYLLRDGSDTEPYQNHIFLLPAKYGGGSPARVEWYALRAVDTTLAGNKDRVFAFTKFPWMVFVSSIHPTILEGWDGTVLKEKGRILTPQVIRDDTFWGFLTSRAAFIDGVSSEPSSIESERVVRAMVKDPQRFLESDSFETMVLERDRIRDEKMQLMPAHVRELVNVITNATDDPTKPKLENRLAVLQSRTIADAISNLPANESSELDTKILSIIIESGKYDRDAIMTLETEHLWVAFMVNPHSTKDDQRSRVEAEVNQLKVRRGSEKIPIVVFSMKPKEDGVNFETGVLLN